MSNVEEFLQALHENEEIKAFMAENALEEGANRDEALVSLAHKFGYDITLEDLTAALDAKVTQIQDVREAAEEAVVELSDEDLAAVAAGSGQTYSPCKDTYNRGENCWSTDSCHNIVDCYGSTMR